MEASNSLWSLLVALVLLTSSCQGQGTSDALCAAKLSCKDCISVSEDCAWCQDRGTNVTRNVTRNVTSTRCRPKDMWGVDNCTNVVNPRSVVDPIKEEILSDKIQVSPQAFNIRLRPGEKVSFDVSVKPAENFPIDLYYLMDMSFSMADDLQNLKKLGGSLADALKEKTDNLQIGFGTFVDKTVDPYVNMANLNDPCGGGGKCRAPFSFINNLPLTGEVQLFVDKVNNETISGNVDFPEGGMDALMQVLVCTDAIGWRAGARKLVLMATDADFHYACDGKLGGAVVPHDGECHLDKMGAGGKYMESVAKTLDYPSVGQINHKVKLTDVIPIFAVVKTYKLLYDNLQTQVTGSFSGELAGDSSNVVDLVKGIYDQIVSTVEPVIPVNQGIDIAFSVQCTENGTVDSKVMKCDKVKLGQEVKFTFNITAGSCEDIEQIESGKISIRFVGFGDVELNLMPICSCDCEKNITKNVTACEGGSLSCGQCLCLEGRFGADCQCTRENAEEDVSKCRDPSQNTDDVCSNRGSCVCGICQCKDSTQYVGEQCQCDNQACKRHNGEICGGPQRGICSCNNKALEPKCKCLSNFRGDACECSLSLEQCRTQPSERVCSDQGFCECGRCVCYEGYRGTLCSICPEGECVGDSCSRNKACAECLQFGSTGKFNCTDDTEKECPPLLVVGSDIPEEPEVRPVQCHTDQGDCTYNYAVYLKSDNSEYGLVVDKEKDCSKSFPYRILILALVLGLLALVLIPLIIWKLATWYKDSLEYQRFQAERAKAKWSKEQNPMYKGPVQKNLNPTYGKA